MAWNREEEEAFALALEPLVTDIADYVRSKLPEGTHFGVIVLSNTTDADGEGRVFAVTSDRQIVAPAAAQWAVNILGQMKRKR